jgi:hypothetical protein
MNESLSIPAFLRRKRGKPPRPKPEPTQGTERETAFERRCRVLGVPAEVLGPAEEKRKAKSRARIAAMLERQRTTA